MNYYGSKNGQGVYQTIINFIPPHKIYIEAFLGSGAILRYKKPAEINIGIEKDRAVINKFWKPTPKGNIILCEDGIQWLKDYPSHGKHVLIYLDPPYPLQSRKEKINKYRYEMTDKQHEVLLQFIVNCESKIMISTYPNAMYAEHLDYWNKKEFYSMTRRGKAKELLYMNFDIPTVLHDYNFLGKDFIDRQRVRRKIQRFISKLAALPPTERNAIISAFYNHSFSPGT